MPSTARDDPAWARFEADIRTRSSPIAADALFFTLELNELEDGGDRGGAAGAPGRRRWRPWLRRVRLSRPHELSADLERMLLDRGPARRQLGPALRRDACHITVRAGREGLTLPRREPAVRRRRRAGASPPPRASPRRWRHARRPLALASTPWPSRSRWKIAGGASRPGRQPPSANEVDAGRWPRWRRPSSRSYPRLSHRYYALKAKAMGRTPARPLGPQRPAHRRRAAPLRLGPGAGDGAGELRRTGAALRRHRRALLRRTLDRRGAAARQISQAPFLTRSPRSGTPTSPSTSWASGATC